MRSLAVATIVISSVLLPACAITQPMTLPEGTASKTDLTIASRAPTAGEMWTSYIIPESNYGVTTNKSGSAAVGVLLGPIGVAANVAYVTQMAEEASKSFDGMIPKNLPARLSESLATKNPDQRFTTAAENPVNGIHMIPGVNLHVIDDKTVNPTCSLRVTELQGKRAVWTAYYRSVFTRSFSLDEKASLAGELGNASLACLNVAYAAYRLHTENRFTPARVVYETGHEADAMIHADRDNALYYVNDQIGVNVVKQSTLKIKPAQQ